MVQGEYFSLDIYLKYTHNFMFEHYFNYTITRSHEEEMECLPYTWSDWEGVVNKSICQDDDNLRLRCMFSINIDFY